MTSEVVWSWIEWGELGEDVRSEARLEQDKAWAHAVADGRAHVSDREAKIQQKSSFRSAIQQYYLVIEITRAHLSQKSCPLSRLSTECIRSIIDFALPGQGILVSSLPIRLSLQSPTMASDEPATSIVNTTVTNKVNNRGIPPVPRFKVCIRKRPLNLFEIQNGDYDSCFAFVPSRDNGHSRHVVVTHDGKQGRTSRRLTMNHKTYVFDRVWDEYTTNDQVCADEIEPLLSHVIGSRGTGNMGSRNCVSTCICFGQTGCGKTHTMKGILSYISERLPQIICGNVEGGPVSGSDKGKDDVILPQTDTCDVTFYEIHGKNCYDLLDNRKKIRLLSDENECVVAHNAKVISLSSDKPFTSKDVMASLEGALKLRSSEVTERNPISSRSHAICTVQFGSGGKLMLVDLAGSERNYETIKMTPSQHRESAAINSDLMALKDCFRYSFAQLKGSKTMTRGISRCINPLHNQVPARAPFRASLLTRALRDCFVFNHSDERQPIAKTLVIAAISPTANDLMHTINTCNHVVLMNPSLHSLTHEVCVEVPVTGNPLSHILVEKWSNEELNNWLAVADGGRFASLTLPPGLTGKDLMSLNSTSLSALFEGQLRTARIEGEGNAWVIGNNRGSSALGRDLFSALRKQNHNCQLLASSHIDV